MNVRKAVGIGILTVFCLSAKAQEAKKNAGVLSGEWRTYFQSTFNKDTLKNFRALATGGKIKYVHSFGERFKIGGALYLSLNTGLQDLTIPDPTTGRISRYETGLFDVKDPGDKFILIPGELFLSYQANDHLITVGRTKLKTPFLNPEDGRMIPTLEQGIWYRYQPEKKFNYQLGIINAIAPRSTDGFFTIGESFGKYPVGRRMNGKRSLYEKNTSSDFIAIGNLSYKFSSKVSLQVWDYYVDNVFHTLYLKPVFKVNESGTRFSLEWLHQDRIGNGGNRRDSLRYFVDQSSNIIGIEFQQKLGKGLFKAGYNHILKGGRFLFPREWGRESLFSFQKRERSEGAANNHAIVLSYDRILKIGPHQLRSILSVGKHWKAELSDAADNKYAQPDYTHINLDLFWQSEKLTRLKPELLLTYKKGDGEIPPNAKFILNKVDLFQINFIVNYTF